ncbi:MAG: hypothetical protein ACE5J5_07120 [Candidatus Hydrothermarchaeales archaeon]
MSYLLVVKYGSDAERKRIEYMLEKWKGKMGVEKPEGVVALISREDPSEMLEDLYSRIPERNVELHSLERPFLDVKKGRKQINTHIEGSQEAVEKFIGFIMAKRKATLKRSLGDMGKVYQTYTKKGRAEIMISTKRSGTGVDLNVTVEGYGDVADFIFEKIREDISYFKG